MSDGNQTDSFQRMFVRSLTPEYNPAFEVQGRTGDLGSTLVVGESNAFKNVVALAAHVAVSRANTVLLVGETGTGKELFARGIHNASRFAGEPFVAINCAAIPESLIESELFGHERGAFTDARQQKRGLMEVAGRGTLFLDEVGELPLKLQAKLLRVLEDRKCRRLGSVEEVPIRARIIAGTNIPLERAVSRGEFREDVFYRLNVVRIDLPPLRERLNDIPALAEHFLREISHEEGNESLLVLSPEAIDALKAHRWPGNVRELKNTLERAALLCESGVIKIQHLMIQQRTAVQVSRETMAAGVIQIPPEGKSLDVITL